MTKKDFPQNKYSNINQKTADIFGGFFIDFYSLI